MTIGDNPCQMLIILINRFFVLLNSPIARPMSLLAESLAGAKYMVATNDDRESSTNGAAEVGWLLFGASTAPQCAVLGRAFWLISDALLLTVPAKKKMARDIIERACRLCSILPQTNAHPR